MKKILTSLSAFSSVGLTAATVVACIPAKFAEGPIGQRVVIVTDGGNIRDRSFNESAWEGVIEYGAQVHQNIYEDAARTKKVDVKTKEEALKFDYASSLMGRQFDPEHPGVDKVKGQTYDLPKKYSSNYVETAGHNTNDFYAGYKMGLYKNADAILLAGFGHLASISKLIEWMEEDEKTLVLLDSSVDYDYVKNADGTDKIDPITKKKIPQKNKNVISVQYNSELSGFNAAWDTALWANMPKIDMATGRWDSKGGLNGDASGNDKISMGTFGGISAKNSVDNSMWGYLVAINLFNDTMAGKTYTLKDAAGVAKEFTPKKIDFGNVGSDNVDKVKASGNSDQTWFSNSFGLGDANKTVLPHLIENKTDIIMGVAGPQTNDIVTPVGAKYSPFIVGIDTDQITSVGKDTNSTDRFITSSIKGLMPAAVEEFKKSKSLKHIYKDEKKKEIEYYVNGNDIDDGQLAEQKPDWVISSSRDAKEKWAPGKNLAINAVKYSEGIGATMFAKLPGIYAAAGKAPENYFQPASIKAATEMIMKASADKPETWTIEQNGISGYMDYFQKFIASLTITPNGGNS
ncbi:hypothetical protein [Williamsoniiplasma lucivorax]|uniref:Ribose/galactose ABC transporter substrate-binding protein n=1 Tax=Williamsoniiplasma lucivorax TaxID=209274 RepID=A0A2S5REE8_9MOLU|nr:hypothetical protein [Williamsoniiplasma lucivorax]PPE05505.1 ribose/galactose ABC transporter substrate-binding protein [Williamsoniiplasma lucivorax]